MSGDVQRAFLIVGIFLCSFTLGSATRATAPARNPVQQMIDIGTIKYVECDLATQVALLKLESNPSNSDAIFAEYGGHIQEGKANLKAAYREAKVGLVGKKTADSMLKDYYAQWLSAIDELLPNSGELKIVYETRKQQASVKLTNLANRLRLELDLD
jgi:hypothetical protein